MIEGKIASFSEETRVLLLQGPSSLFFKELGIALRARGASVTRLGFCPGDRLYWSRRAGRFIRCAVAKDAFCKWIEQFLSTERPTDIVMLGDGRFYHRETLAVAKRLPVRPRFHIIEHGLIRPGWILVEPNGMGSASIIPRTFRPSEQHEAPIAPAMVPSTFLRYAALDVAYHTAGMMFGRCYNRHYVRHSIDPPHREYAGWVRKLLLRPRSLLGSTRDLRRIEDADGRPVFLFPLQLESDFQIRDHGGGLNLREHLDRVLRSFARQAPKDALLIVKRHPLDSGLTPWQQIISSACLSLGIEDRVIYLERGVLQRLLDVSQGVITINSSVGLQAILRGIPCLTLGSAVFDLPGLTSPGSIDRFWRKRTPPDPVIASRFHDFVLARYHVPGAFNGSGLRIGAATLAERICA